MSGWPPAERLLSETIPRIPDAVDRGRAQAALACVSQASATLLAEQSRRRDGAPTPHDAVREIDLAITRLVEEALESDPRTRADVLISEDGRRGDPVGRRGAVVFILDAVDNTQGYANGDPHFGCALLGVDAEHGDVVVSVFAKPALSAVYVYARGLGSVRSEGGAVRPMTPVPRGAASRAVVRRPRRESDLSADAARVCASLVSRFEGEGLRVERGSDIPAFDVLELAERGDPACVVAVAKVWDFCPAAAIAAGAGARVRRATDSADVFPLGASLREKARTGEREVFLVERA